MSYRITAATISDYKRVRTVKITPGSDVDVILIGGKNAQGKSSILDALAVAFGGKKLQAADPVRHGAEEASIDIELDNGALTIKRVIQPDGDSSLEVRNVDGSLRSPQAVLDKLFAGGRFLDPLAFLALDAAKQRIELMKLIPNADRMVSLDDKYRSNFEKRTEVGRDLAKAEGELARLPAAEVGVPIDVAALSAERAAFADEQRAGDGLGAAKAKAEAEAARANDRHGVAVLEIAALERRLEETRALADELATERGKASDRAVELGRSIAAAVAKWVASQARRGQLDADLARADQHNREVFAVEAQQKRRAETKATVEQLVAETARLTGVLDAIKARKAEILAAAKLPVEGLGVTADGIELAGVPFAQASRAEQVRVALALAMAASPGLDDVWVRDGAVLDDEMLAAIVKHAHEAGKRPWIERVGDRDPGVIVIQDGKVKK